jgi:quinol monooxygenase YgiN
MIRARAVNQATAETWAAARQVASEMVSAAIPLDGVSSYEMYEDPAQLRLVNLAEYADEAAWQRWIATNKGRSARLMSAVEVLSMEVYGQLSPELSATIESYASATVYQPLEL